MNDDRQARLTTATTEQYAALGRFIQSFELVCHALRPLFAASLHKHGLHPSGQIIANMAVYNKHVAAAALKDIVASAYCEAVREDQTAVSVMKNIHKRFQDLIEARNRAMHGTWFIGYASSEQEDFSEITGVYPALSTSGFGLNRLPKSVAELDKLSEEAAELAKLAQLLMLPLIPGAPPADRTFVQEGNLWKQRVAEASPPSD